MRSSNGERFDVFARSGKVAANRDAVEWAIEAESRGAGEILLTSIDRDGTRAGFDCELTAAVSSAVSIPVIASGGAGTFDHFLEVFTGGKADAALAASIFHYSEHAVSDLKQFPQRARRAVRMRSTPMLIPSIDLQGGRIVQLVQGEKLAVETSDFDGWIERFAGYPKVQLIDLDAAKNAGANEALIARSARDCPAASAAASAPRNARAQLVGARRDGSDPRVVALSGTASSISSSRSCVADAVRLDRFIAAVDSRGGRVVVDGWRTTLAADADGRRARARAVRRRVSVHPRRPRRPDAGNRHGAQSRRSATPRHGG